eukprot:gnl/TRDRNA2_/TRDRNA2_203822_c0_seq1.p1 gnl/TRDRNA2_/TRDRNA2_203822_c0~~gnl/TRDRNA2_/TRDRNA2_203822_c0_seq1.p1  ORF type:complete len:563 (-),score=89.94 gnl/TRDRNA2_/TRDRNA2_203822_c0_seq1:75-1763(-)
MCRSRVQDPKALYCQGSTVDLSRPRCAGVSCPALVYLALGSLVGLPGLYGAVDVQGPASDHEYRQQSSASTAESAVCSDSDSGSRSESCRLQPSTFSSSTTTNDRQARPQRSVRAEDDCDGWKCYQLADELIEALASRQGDHDFCDFGSFYEDGTQLNEPEQAGASQLNSSQLPDERTPMVLRGVKDLLLMKGKFGKQNLRKAAKKHNLNAQVGYSWDIVMSRGQGPKTVPLWQYIDDLMDKDEYVGKELLERIYMFDRTSNILEKLRLTLSVPSLIQSWNATAFRPETAQALFLLGAPRSGVAFHRHTAAVHLTMHGVKRWLLYPPQANPPGGVHGSWPIFDWLRNVYPDLKESQKPLECIQKPGDVLYIPEGWYHAVVNLADSVAVSLQRRHLTTDIMSTEVSSKTATEPKQIIKGAKKLLKLQPADLDARMRIGEAYRDLGKEDEAIKALSMVVRKDPYFVSAQYTLAGIYKGREEPQDSRSLSTFQRELGEWKPYLEKNKWNLQSNFMLSEYFNAVGNQSASLRYLRWNVKLQAHGIVDPAAPDFAEMLRMRAAAGRR